MSLLHRPFLHEKSPKEPSRFLAFWARLCKWTMRLVFLAVCACATAYLFAQGYPKPSFSLLMWLALAPFVLGVVRLKGFWRAVWYSWFTGLLVYGALYHWVFVTCVKGGGMEPGLSSAAWLGLSALMAVQFAVFGAGCFYLKRLGGAFPVLAAMGWVALEWAHEMLATYALGFPWFSLAYSQWNLPQILQIAPFTGAAGVSFLTAFSGVSVGYAFATPKLGRGVLQLVFAGLAFCLPYGYGQWALSRPAPRTLLSLRAAVMQPNIDQYKKWSAEFEEEILNVVSDMGRSLEGTQTLLTVWPESVTPGPVQEEPYFSLISDLAKDTASWQLAGSNRTENGEQYVSAFLFSPDEETVVSFYDKTHLVPFGEFIPLERTVRSLLPDVAVLGELGSFSPGKWEQPLLQASQLPFGTTICYESVFSSLWRRQAKAGAKFFVNLTNDAWFFDTAAPYQHLAVSVLRAAELNRPVLRAANTGISAVIAADGQILSRAELGTRAVLTADVPLKLGTDVSFYTRWGDWFAWLCAAVFFTILLSVMVFSYE